VQTFVVDTVKLDVDGGHPIFVFQRDNGMGCETAEQFRSKGKVPALNVDVDRSGPRALSSALSHFCNDAVDCEGNMSTLAVFLRRCGKVQCL